jgi:serine/threonine protein kinase
MVRKASAMPTVSEQGLTQRDTAIGTLPYTSPEQIRGETLDARTDLLLHQGAEAAAEFQKFLDHPTLVANNPLFPLAHLGLPGAYALQGQTDKSRAAYQEFFTLWKDADPDIPILQQAKAEYAKLQ